MLPVKLSHPAVDPPPNPAWPKTRMPPKRGDRPPEKPLLTPRLACVPCRCCLMSLKVDLSAHLPPHPRGRSSRWDGDKRGPLCSILCCVLCPKRARCAATPDSAWRRLNRPPLGSFPWSVVEPSVACQLRFSFAFSILVSKVYLTLSILQYRVSKKYNPSATY